MHLPINGAAVDPAVYELEHPSRSATFLANLSGLLVPPPPQPAKRTTARGTHAAHLSFSFARRPAHRSPGQAELVATMLPKTLTQREDNRHTLRHHSPFPTLGMAVNQATFVNSGAGHRLVLRRDGPNVLSRGTMRK